jgi:hypothetical protein
VIGLIIVGLLVVALVACLTTLAWVAACRRWEVRAERARIDTEVRRAERRLHGLASQAFASMLETTRGHSGEGNE